jgi:hypothetical protein
MSLRDWISKLRRNAHPIIIDTQWGPVSESARHQAALNLRDDPEKRAMCEAKMVMQMGDFEAAMVEMRRRYPEAYENEPERKGILR